MPKRRRQNKINKRRIVKKRIIKKQQQNKSTPEQNAKHNELLKMLLNRQQPTIPTANPEITKLNNEIRDLQDRNNKTLSIMEMKKQEKENELSRKKEIEDKEFELKRLQKEDEAKQKHEQKEKDLKLMKSVYDGRSTLGKLKKQTKALQDEYDAYKLQIKQNDIYNKLDEKEQENNNLQVQIQAQKEIINSDKFKNPDPSYIAELKKQHELKLQLENNKRVMERQQQLQQESAEYEAEKNGFDNYWNTPIHRIEYERDPITNLPILDKNTYNPIYKTEIDKDGSKQYVVVSRTQREQNALLYQAQKQANYENEESMRKLNDERKRLINMNNERQQIQNDNIIKQNELNYLKARNEISEENIKRELTEEEKQKIKDAAKTEADINLQKQQLINNQELAEANRRSRYLKSINDYYKTDEYKNSLARIQQEKHLIKQKEQENINKERLYEANRKNIELNIEKQIIDNYASGDYSDPNAALQIANDMINYNHDKNIELSRAITERNTAINKAINRFKNILGEEGENKFYEFFKSASEIKKFSTEPDYTQLNPEYYRNLANWINLIGDAEEEIIRNKNNEFSSWIDRVNI